MNPLQIEDLIHYRFLSGVELAPDGQKAAFIVKQADWEANDYGSNLWLYRRDTQAAFQLTASNKDSAFVWLGDSQHLLFASRRSAQEDDAADEEQTEMYRISIQGGEAQPAFTLPHKVVSLRRLDDRRLVYTAVVDLDREERAPEDETAQAAKLREARQKEEKDYRVLEEIPFWSNGEGFISRKRTHLFLWDTDRGESTELTEGPLNVLEYDVRGEKIAFVAVEFEGKMPTTNDVYLLDLAERQPKRLTGGDRVFDLVRFLADDVLVVSSTDMQPYGINQNHELYALRLADRRLELLTPGWDRSVRSSVSSDCRLGQGPASRVDGELFYFISTEGDSSYVYRLSLAGQVERLVDQPGSVDSFDVRNGVAVYVALRGDRLQELYVWEDGQERQVTHLNETILADKTLSTPEHFEVQTRDGTRVDAWVVKPAGFEAGRKYPAILEIHGGPKTVSSHVFFHEYQVLANRGYVVFFSNPRGGDGKGDAFADIRGKYGTIDYEDLMAVVDHVVAHFDFVDPGRLGVTGGSYGGFMTNWIIGHTDRFKAAASQRSIANWASFILNSDIGYWFGPDQVGATLWEDADKMWFHSPLRYADQVETPTLFIHSAEDYRCWIPEGLQMFAALKYFGVESRLCWFEGENHELSRGGKPKHRVRRLREIVEWFDRYLK